MYKTVVLKDHLNHPYYHWPVTMLTESVEFAAPAKPGCWQLLDGEGNAVPFQVTDVEVSHGLAVSAKLHFVASLAPYVFAAHAQGDKVATDILEQNAKGLAMLIESARRRHGNLTELVADGGIFERNREVFEPMIQKFLQKPLTFIYPKLPPVYGACVGCCKQEKIPLPEDFYEKFYQSYTKLLHEE